MTKKAIVIGSGIGGIAAGIRLQSLGFQTCIVEKLDAPGGRAYVHKAAGFTFDMGPTVLTVPHFIEELFALEKHQPNLDTADFPQEILNTRIRQGISGGPATSNYVQLVPILPFYRIYFDDGSYFDYDGDPEHTKAQIKALAPEDLEGYEAFHKAAKDIFERGFIELGYTYFGNLASMFKVSPDLVRLDALRSLFSFVKKYFKSDKMRQVFSFEPLLVGGNPLRVPAIYAMIHFVEKTWGIHFAMGGTGALVQGLIKKFEDLGGEIRFNSEVTQIEVKKVNGHTMATGVNLKQETLASDLVVANSDYAHTYLHLIDSKHRKWNRDFVVKARKQSMSLFVLYFGFKSEGLKLDLRHHNIILGPRYEALLTDIFDRKVLADDFSQYLHIPSLTDPSLAPENHHAAYTLVPVPHQGSKLNWSEIGDSFAQKILTFLEEHAYIPELSKRLVYKHFITPDYFETTLNSYLGNGFGPEPILRQSAFFRPHNRSEDIKNLYLVGQGSQPGGGTPSVMMSAKMTARLIAEDFSVKD